MGWLERLKSGLSKTSDRVSDGLHKILLSQKLDEETLEALEELLIEADLGAATSSRIIADLSKEKLDEALGPAEVKALLADRIATILKPVSHPLILSACARPHVVLVVGVNGNGKTTTIGKLGQHYVQDGKKVMFAAADTFRAAAVQQLKLWADKVGAGFVSGEENADPASVAYHALERAQKEGAEVLLIDTAGRLQNKSNLMEELKKITKVLKKLDEEAPHTVLQVLDGTTGQNAISQVEVFRDCVDVSGLVVTKLDGTARAGIVVALAQQFGLPMYAIGVGETAEDLQPFRADDFARQLVGLAA